MIRAPFPWFGGKSRAAHIVWAAFGDVPNYVEPFAGSLAVLLARPTAPRIETVNDLDAYLANFWRAVQHAPADVAKHADWPVNEADLHARHLWLVQQHGFRERMLTDPDFYDAKIAGWWVWGLSAWLGSGWCDTSRAAPGRQMPFVGNGGRGVHRQSSDASKEIHAISSRLRRVRVACGSWERVLTDSVTIHVGRTTGVLLDPPYADGNMDYAAGGVGGSVSAEVRRWAIDHGDDKRLRIALCGYEGEHDMPASWACVPWKAKGGYAKTDEALANARRERIWLSPHCLPVQPAQQALFGVAP